MVKAFKRNIYRIWTPDRRTDELLVEATNVLSTTFNLITIILK